MTVQVIADCSYEGGALAHALALAVAFRHLAGKAEVVDLGFPTAYAVREAIKNQRLELVEAPPQLVPDAELSVVVDLSNSLAVTAATNLVDNSDRKVVLVPTGYLDGQPTLSLSRRVSSIWFVSWEQAAYSRAYWNLADEVHVVQCAVDVARFRPTDRSLPRTPWVACRHSRDVPEKFSRHVLDIIDGLARTHSVSALMLGAVDALGHRLGNNTVAFRQSAMDPATFLQKGHIWIYDHADYWRESACIAALEAMASGLPVLVSNSGGMREYIVHGETGFLCSNPEEFMAFARLLFDEQDLYERMSCRARRFVEERHSLDALTNRVSELVLPLLDS